MEMLSVADKYTDSQLNYLALTGLLNIVFQYQPTNSRITIKYKNICFLNAVDQNLQVRT